MRIPLHLQPAFFCSFLYNVVCEAFSTGRHHFSCLVVVHNGWDLLRSTGEFLSRKSAVLDHTENERKILRYLLVHAPFLRDFTRFKYTIRDTSLWGADIESKHYFAKSTIVWFHHIRLKGMVKRRDLWLKVRICMPMEERRNQQFTPTDASRDYAHFSDQSNQRSDDKTQSSAAQLALLKVVSPPVSSSRHLLNRLALSNSDSEYQPRSMWACGFSVTSPVLLAVCIMMCLTVPWAA